MDEYLVATDVIDWQHPAVSALARRLADGAADVTEVTRRCFEWVRDEIHHSVDYQMNPVTWRASDVLQYKTGYCYAKSHLLAALLRANQIPAGFAISGSVLTTTVRPIACTGSTRFIYLRSVGIEWMPEATKQA